MLIFKEIYKTYDHQKTLQNINLTISPQEFVLLTGPSGAGKSTLLHLLIGAEKPTSGSIQVDEIRIENLNTESMQVYRRLIGMVFQDYKLLPQKTVFENVAFAMEVCGEPDDKIEKRVSEVLHKVGLLPKSANFPHQLSGGEKQRVAIARALVHEPKLLIADEPTGNLDWEASLQIIQLLKQINQDGVTIILATHDHTIMNYLQTRVIALRNGEIVSDNKR